MKGSSLSLQDTLVLSPTVASLLFISISYHQLVQLIQTSLHIGLGMVSSLHSQNCLVLLSIFIRSLTVQLMKLKLQLTSRTAKVLIVFLFCALSSLFNTIRVLLSLRISSFLVLSTCKTLLGLGLCYISIQLDISFQLSIDECSLRTLVEPKVHLDVFTELGGNLRSVSSCASLRPYSFRSFMKIRWDSFTLLFYSQPHSLFFSLKTFEMRLLLISLNIAIYTEIEKLKYKKNYVCTNKEVNNEQITMNEQVYIYLCKKDNVQSVPFLHIIRYKTVTKSFCSIFY